MSFNKVKKYIIDAKFLVGTYVIQHLFISLNIRKNMTTKTFQAISINVDGTFHWSNSSNWLGWCPPG